jgi:hypothetical protein
MLTQPPCLCCRGLVQQLQSELALVQSKAGAETEALSQREGKLQKQLQKLLGELEKEKEHQLETLQEVRRAQLGSLGAVICQPHAGHACSSAHHALTGSCVPQQRWCSSWCIPRTHVICCVR